MNYIYLKNTQNKMSRLYLYIQKLDSHAYMNLKPSPYILRLPRGPDRGSAMAVGQNNQKMVSDIQWPESSVCPKDAIYKSKRLQMEQSVTRTL